MAQMEIVAPSVLIIDMLEKDGCLNNQKYLFKRLGLFSYQELHMRCYYHHQFVVCLYLTHSLGND